MITIYGASENNFNHNGYGVLQALKAEVTEELNGMFELELTLPNTEKTSGQLENIINFNIIKAPTPNGAQLFRIYQVKKNMAGYIQVNARHIFYDGLFNMVSLATGEHSSINAAIKNIYQKAAQGTSFNVSGDIPGTISYEYSNCNIVSCLLGDDGIIKALGSGELLRDNFNIYIKSRIGSDKGFKVQYRKNLAGLDIEDNTENIITRIKPIALDIDGSKLYLPETYINSPRVGSYFMPLYGVLNCNDIKVGKGDYLSTTDAFAAMRQRANAFFSGGGDMPLVNAKINFVLLGDTLEYADFKGLEQISLGDTVKTEYPRLNFTMESHCIKYIYNAITGRYKSIELGSFRNDFAKNTSNNISSLQTEVTGTGTMANRLAILETRMDTHAHKGETDKTQRVNYYDLSDRP